MSTIAVIGAGYVGLTAAACFARLGHTVTCADVDAVKVERLSRGELPIVEEGLDEVVTAGLAAGRLRFVVGSASAAAGAEFVFLCLPTPSRADGGADLSFVESAIRELAPVLAPGAVVVSKSTMPVGSSRKVARLLRGAGAPPDVEVVVNPEFLREGTAMRDFLFPDRVVIGALCSAAAVRLREVYAKVPAPVVTTDPASAEMIKYASNAFLAVKVSFINSISGLCDAMGADVEEVASGMGLDRRIGPEFLRAGPGFGGSCFPKDTAALLRMGDDVGDDLPLLRGVLTANGRQRDRVVAKIRRAAGGLAGRRVAIWGLAFKAGTDDLRDSPALAVARALLAEGARVSAYDPAAGPAAAAALPDADVCEDPYEACVGADVLVVLTEWPEFRGLDPGAIRAVMARPAVVDARNLLDAGVLAGLGFDYEGIGRGRQVEPVPIAAASGRGRRRSHQADGYVA